jgi:NitT/TauT family transport system permease protein
VTFFEILNRRSERSQIAKGKPMRRLMNIAPSRANALLLGLAPLAAILLIYVSASIARLAANPTDKLLPSFAAISDVLTRYALHVDPRTGDVLLWSDTLASLERLALGLGLATLIGLALGIALGVVPLVRATFGIVVAIIAVVPPMAILPILFIVFGLGETSKVALIVIGVTPYLVRDLAFQGQALPIEQNVKAQTLGASTWQYVIRVALPQLLPRLIEGVRLSLGPAWLFLIAAEAIASENGLGYRIFLVRRYLAMDVILPYVAWITLIAFVSDLALAALSRKAFPWAHPKEAR